MTCNRTSNNTTQLVKEKWLNKKHEKENIITNLIKYILDLFSTRPSVIF